MKTKKSCTIELQQAARGAFSIFLDEQLLPPTEGTWAHMTDSETGDDLMWIWTSKGEKEALREAYRAAKELGLEVAS